MRKTSIAVILISIFLLAACNGSGDLTDTKTITAKNEENVIPFTIKTVKPEKIEIPQRSSFINLDELEQYGVRYGESKELSEEDLESLSKDEQQKDYVEVAKAYVKHELKQEPLFLDSRDGSYNPRSIIIGTKEGNVYLLKLQKW